MTTITIAQHWADELAELRQDSSATNIADIVDITLQQYMFRQRQEKVARERRWYKLHYHELVQQYAGQYIAIHNSRVMDADPDGRRLSRRIRQQHGRIAIAIIQVTDSPEPPTLYVRSPKSEQPETDEAEWLYAAARNPAFKFLHDPAEDIYSLTDGQPFYCTEEVAILRER